MSIVSSLIVFLGAIVSAGKMDDRFVLYHPLHNGTFKHWKASGSSVFQVSKTTLVPELPNQKGLIYAKHTMNLPDFEMEIDLSIHNKQETSFSLGNFKLFVLRDNPMKSAFEYAHGLDGLYDGLVIEIAENKLRNTNKVKKSDSARLHDITGYLRNEEYNLINDVKES